MAKQQNPDRKASSQPLNTGTTENQKADAMPAFWIILETESIWTTGKLPIRLTLTCSTICR